MGICFFSAFRRLKTAQEAANIPQERPRGLQESPMTASEASKTAPRRPQDGPQDAPRSNSARGHACDYVCALAKSSRKQLCPAKGLTRCSRAAQGEALVSYIPCAPRGRPDRGLLRSYRAYTCWAHCEMRSVDCRSFTTLPCTCFAHVCLQLILGVALLLHPVSMATRCIITPRHSLISCH